MITTAYRVTYHGPTNYRGSRHVVKSLKSDGKAVTVPFNHAASNAAQHAVELVARADDETAVITYGGEDARHTYYVVTPVPAVDDSDAMPHPDSDALDMIARWVRTADRGLITEGEALDEVRKIARRTVGLESS